MQPFRASRLRTAFFSSESLCKINHLFLIIQVFESSETCCSTLFNVIPQYTKIFAVFFGNFNYYLYLCIIKHVSLKTNHHATFQLTFQFSFQHRSTRQALLPFGEVGRGLWPYGACHPLLPTHSTTNRLAETPRTTRH